MCNIGSSITNTAEFCRGRACSKGYLEEQVGDVFNDCNAGHCGSHVGVEAAVSCVHVCFIHPDFFGWVSLLYVMDAM